MWARRCNAHSHVVAVDGLDELDRRRLHVRRGAEQLVQLLRRGGRDAARVELNAVGVQAEVGHRQHDLRRVVVQVRVLEAEVVQARVRRRLRVRRERLGEREHRGVVAEAVGLLAEEEGRLVRAELEDRQRRVRLHELLDRRQRGVRAAVRPEDDTLQRRLHREREQAGDQRLHAGVAELVHVDGQGLERRELRRDGGDGRAVRDGVDVQVQVLQPRLLRRRRRIALRQPLEQGADAVVALAGVEQVEHLDLRVRHEHLAEVVRAGLDRVHLQPHVPRVGVGRDGLGDGFHRLLRDAVAGQVPRLDPLRFTDEPAERALVGAVGVVGEGDVVADEEVLDRAGVEHRLAQLREARLRHLLAEIQPAVGEQDPALHADRRRRELLRRGHEVDERLEHGGVGDVNRQGLRVLDRAVLALHRLGALLQLFLVVHQAAANAGEFRLELLQSGVGVLRRILRVEADRLAGLLIDKEGLAQREVRRARLRVLEAHARDAVGGLRRDLAGADVGGVLAEDRRDVRADVVVRQRLEAGAVRRVVRVVELRTERGRVRPGVARLARVRLELVDLSQLRLRQRHEVEVLQQVGVVGRVKHDRTPATLQREGDGALADGRRGVRIAHRDGPLVDEREDAVGLEANAVRRAHRRDRGAQERMELVLHHGGLRLLVRQAAERRVLLRRELLQRGEEGLELRRRVVGDADDGNDAVRLRLHELQVALDGHVLVQQHAVQAVAVLGLLGRDVGDQRGRAVHFRPDADIRVLARGCDDGAAVIVRDGGVDERLRDAVVRHRVDRHAERDVEHLGLQPVRAERD
mmetsp:Transcript_40174/g.124132  ORF Transcript_40174/g.124132 Transcript_40174/m.124132 type:complete len:806 (-) Transcript_40174:189-2606(-)